MRNVSEYPITAEEVKEALESIPHAPPMMVGGVSVMVRQGIISFFEKRENMDALLAQFKE